MNPLPPLSLYVHLPWCVRKCPYCDFNSHALGKELPREGYVDALLADLRREARSGRDGGRSIQSIFLGGGTPSLFRGEDIARLLDGVRQHFRLDEAAEITLEANPGATERDNLAHYHEAGVNRLSLGAQSFDAEALKRLGRIHGRQEIYSAFEDALSAGFSNVNLDLMFALPQQSTADALDDLSQAVSLSPTHISWYQLTLEPNTVFFARPPQGLPDDDAAWQMQSEGQALLAAAGFAQYEISAYARAGYRCRHNLNYWRFGDYLAVGAGAHGKFTDRQGRISRYRKPAHPQSYMLAAGAAGDDAGILSEADVAFEYMLNVLRLPDGFSEREFAERTGLSPAVLRPAIGEARSLGLLGAAGSGHWRPTARGLRFLNDLQGLFLPPATAARGA
ncbi:MAG: radical SAM family heme chaperone HemW [Gammaproteobacteria bacterium]|nr:radical SAM family heme chaperone HemW [Gammaproteobacteria bacterium]